MAETLQRSLLLAGLPEVDGLEVVTRYLPAVRGTAAGGDWYDLHRLPTGPAPGSAPSCAVSVIGDAAGTVLPAVPERERLLTRGDGVWSNRRMHAWPSQYGHGLRVRRRTQTRPRR
jgi:hypothetical protein